ncbi:MAG TPA: PEGA domain-containing protein [Thermoanaerobaculia bacterium]|nr:PEGA domain-containing protein [Thermoanaerobaculia bacterium]
MKTIAALLVVLLVSSIAGCSSAPVAEAMPPGIDPAQIAAAVDSANVAVGANLPLDARKEIVRQIIEEERAGWTGADESRFDRYKKIHYVMLQNTDTSRMEAVLIEAKVKNVEPAIDAELERTKAGGTNLSNAADAKIREDLRYYVSQMAASGYPTGQMQSVANEYVRTIIKRVGKTLIDLQDYAKAKLEIIDRNVQVTFDSVPRFATVSVAERPVGQTTIVQLLQGDRFYHVRLERNGYEPYSRNVYVPATDLPQILKPTLQPTRRTKPPKTVGAQ